MRVDYRVSREFLTFLSILSLAVALTGALLPDAYESMRNWMVGGGFVVFSAVSLAQAWRGGE